MHEVMRPGSREDPSVSVGRRLPTLPRGEDEPRKASSSREAALDRMGRVRERPEKGSKSRVRQTSRYHPPLHPMHTSPVRVTRVT